MVSLVTQAQPQQGVVEPITRKKTTDSLALRVTVLTKNPFKKREFTKDLAEPYGLTVSFKDPTEQVTDQVVRSVLAQTAPSPHFIIREETRLLNGVTREPISIVEQPEDAPNFVVNESTIAVWVPKWENDTFSHFEKYTYTHSIKGFIDHTKKDKRTEEVYGWDHLFVNPLTGKSNQEADSSDWGKLSARQLVLSDFIQNHLFYERPQTLSHHHELNPKQGVEFTSDMAVCRFMRENRYLSNPHLDTWGLFEIRERILNEGVFFKSATSRPIKNYFTPPFAGVPLTAKKTDVEETIFMMHDLNHHNIPDLVFDGDGSDEMRNVYVAWRMMSEAMTLVIADMLYADTLVQTDPENKKKVDQRIYPLFEALAIEMPTKANREKIIKQLLWANTKYAVLGDDSEWKKLLKPGSEKALEAYKNHFEKFFIGDHVWTKKNFENMVASKERFTSWIELLGRDTFSSAGVYFLSDVVGKIKERGAHLTCFPEVVESVFNEIIETRIFPPATQKLAFLDEEERLSRAFRRYMIGQLSFYPHYRALPGVIERGRQLAKTVGQTRHFDARKRKEVYFQYKNDVRYVWGTNVITSSTAENYLQLHPIFPPVYINYNRQSSTTVREALYKLYTLIDPTVVYLNTSNKGKLEEYKTYFYPKTVVCLTTDVREPDADPETIIRYKASQFEHVVVDDVALNICDADVGTNVRWNLEKIESGCFTGKRCDYVCRVARAVNGCVLIYFASVKGQIVEKRGDCFGFGSYFLPDGTTKTLGEYMDPSFNARALAIEQYKKDAREKTVPTLSSWEGPFQNEK